MTPAPVPADPVLVLASASPRRAMLLARIGLTPVVRPTAVDEAPHEGEPVADLVVRLATAKATAAQDTDDEIVLGADTEVVLDDTPLGKPADAEAARRMLRALSGRAHEVLTGVAVRRGATTFTALARTRVVFRPLGEDEIDWYLATDEPWDKAGSYAIQGAGGALVEQIEGSDSNVIGLPLAVTVALLREAGLDPLHLR